MASELVTSMEKLLELLSSPGPERVQAEAQLDQLLRDNMGATLTGLVQVGAGITGTTTETTRVLAFVLLRRYAFKPLPLKVDEPADVTSSNGSRQGWDLIDDQAKKTIQAGLLHALGNAGLKRENERGIICDVVSEVENAGTSRGGIPWPELRQALTQLFASEELVLREAVFRIYSETFLLEGEEPATVIAGLSAGLKDPSPGVRTAALKAATNVITMAETDKIDQLAPLVVPMLEILPPLAAERQEQRLTDALLTFINLASTPKVPSRIFKPHMSSILTFVFSILLPSPFNTSPNYSENPFDETVRNPALEFLISIAETAPSMTKSFAEFPRKVVPVLLSLMTEREEDASWYESQVFNEDDNDSMCVLAESALDRLSQALHETIFPAWLSSLQPLLTSPTWQVRYAALSSIASIAEGCVDQVRVHLQPLKQAALQAMQDKDPRVCFAGVYALGQLCTDLEGAMQEQGGEESLRALIQVTNRPEQRLQAYGAAAMFNFFNGADVDTEPLANVLPEVFAQLLKLLQQSPPFVKGHALKAIGALSVCMDREFGQFYPQIMPHLITLLETGDNDPDLADLLLKSIETSAQIMGAVDASIAVPDAARLLAAYEIIRSGIQEDDDQADAKTKCLLRGFAALSETVGPEMFKPYAQFTFSSLMAEACKRPDLTITASDENEEDDDDEEWDAVEVNGDVVAIRTVALEEKADAMNNLVVVVQSISSILPPESLQAVLRVAEGLLGFIFHNGIRESAAALMVVALQGLARTPLTAEQRTLLLNAVSDAFAKHIAQDTDAVLVSILISSWNACYNSLAGALGPPQREYIIKALEGQLTQVYNREERGGDEGYDEDDDVEDSENKENDLFLLATINSAIRDMLKVDKSVPVGPFLPFLRAVNGKKAVTAHFAMRLMSDIIEHTGDNSVPHIKPYLDRVLVALSDADNVTRRIASYLVGVAAESCPATLLDFSKAAIEPLFHAVGALDMNDQQLLAARDNAVSALSKILRFQGDQVSADALLPRWVAALPIFVDEDEMSPCYTLLLDLIARGHASVLPASGAAPHVVKVLVSALENKELPASIQRPIAQALKTYVAGAMESGIAVQVSPEVEAKVVALLA
ncbi:ARM repeat-containing protein [Meredithblackwellia eburnea MCA 4105]